MALVGAALAVALGLGNGGTAPQRGDEVTGSVPAEGERFVLRSSTTAAPCRLSMDGDPAGPGGRLLVEPGCRTVAGGSSAAVGWRRTREGSLLFVGRDGGTLVAFTPGDGVAYESYEPAHPILTLGTPAE